MIVSRVTQNSLVRVLNSNAGRLQAELVRAQAVVSSQKRIQSASDDPIGTALINELRAEGTRLDSLLDGVGFGQAVLGTEDGALDEATAILTRARELAVQFANDTTGVASRQAAAEEVEELERALILLGNTTVSGRHVFGGLGSAPAFTAFDDPGFNPATAYVGPADPFTILTASDQQTRLTTPGGQVFTAALVAIDDLRQTLAAGQNTQGNIAALSSASDAVIQERASVGGRLQRLNARDSEIRDSLVATQIRRGKVEDADVAAAISDLVQIQNALEVTLTAGRALLGASILDFLGP
jgi:flagellar hook-associated protein 3 FlgL